MSKNNNKRFTAKDRYKYLVNARNFHYENFNKWLTYFYLANGALFVGYYSIAIEKNMVFEQLILIILGYISSLFWYWSSKGYYYWNINFIKLIMDCEENQLKLKKKERVYFVFANKKIENDYFNPTKGANISTSKIAILFAFIIAIGWNCLLLKKIFEYFEKVVSICCILFIALFMTVIFGAAISYFLKSKMENFPDLKI